MINKNDFFCLENDASDIIFNGNKVYGDTQPAYLDNDRNIPDYKYYLFSTMGKNVKAINSRNMVLPIREKLSINNPQTYYTILNKLTNTDKLENGIYIVEYYNFNAIMSNNEENNILNYYKHIDNLQYSKQTIMEIKDFIDDVIMRNKVDCLTMAESIRIITFVPESALKEHTTLYNKSCDLLLVYGDVNEDTKHPVTSNDNEEIVETVNNEVLASIEIIDNETNNPKWIKIGSEVVKINPSKSNIKGTSATLHITRNNATIMSKTVDKEDMMSLGVYDTKEAVISNNNPEAMIALRELEFKNKELDYKYNKLLADKENLLMELQTAKDKVEYERKKYEMEIEKLLMGESLSYTKDLRKLEIDTKTNEYKLAGERMKLAIERTKYLKTKTEIGTKVASNLLGLIKF